MSEKAQEYQQYLDNQNAQRHRMKDEDLNLLRDPHSLDDVDEPISPTKNHAAAIALKNRRTSFRTEESADDRFDKIRKMTVDSGQLESASKAPKESRLQ